MKSASICPVALVMKNALLQIIICDDEVDSMIYRVLRCYLRFWFVMLGMVSWGRRSHENFSCGISLIDSPLR